MARRKRSTKRNRRQAAGAMLLVVGLVLALSFLPEATGLPIVLGRGQTVLFGRAAWLIPLAAVAAGAALLLAGAQARLGRTAAGLALLALAGTTAFHVRIAAGDEIRAGMVGQGAGVVAGAILLVLRRGFGEAGSWLVITLAAVAGLLLASGVSLAVALGAIWAALVWVVQALAATVNAVAVTLVRAVAGTGLVLRQFVAGVVSRLAMLRPAPSPAGPPPAPPRMRHDESPQAITPLEPAAGIRTDAAIRDRAITPAPGADRFDPRADRRDLQDRRGPAAPFQQETLALEVPSGGYQLPPLSLLSDLPAGRGRGKSDPAEVARALEQTLASFGVEAKATRWEQGPVVTRFEVQPAPGVRVQKISSLTNDIALALAAPSVRIEAPIPGKSAVGVEIPNQKTSLVHIKDMLASDDYQRTPGPLVVPLGKDIAGHPIVADLTEMPHLLIAGATGSGKSVMLNAIIAGLLFRGTPLDVRLLMIDPKRVEFANYNNIPHLLAPVVTNPRAAAGALKEMLREMEDRFGRFAATGTRNIQTYNQLTDVDRLPYIVIVVDELADLMMIAPADFEDVICRLAQMTRATGIHMVVATQRPSVDVITGLIKANIPSRIAFAVSSQVDSRTILDMPGAEKLLGKGDMLYLPMGAARATRAQGAFIADSEIQALVAWWKSQGKPIFDQKVLKAEAAGGDTAGGEDELLADAARLVVRAGYGSVSLLQRKMKIGYVRAARIVDQLEERGIVGPTQGSNPREVLVGVEELERLLRKAEPAAP